VSAFSNFNRAASVRELSWDTSLLQNKESNNSNSIGTLTPVAIDAAASTNSLPVSNWVQ
jgi:hypothetical protein